MNDDLGNAIVSHTYGAEGGQNQSLVLDPELNGGNAYVQHTAGSTAGGSAFSAGTQMDGERYPGCSEDEESSLVINEVLAIPQDDVNGDGATDDGDAFVELFNLTTIDRNISGWTLSDATRVRHVFPDGSAIVGQCGLVIFGGGEFDFPFTGSDVQVASEGSLGLDANGDTLTLQDAQGRVVTTMTYASAPSGDSLNLDPDQSGSSYSPHQVVGGDDNTYSPGSAADGGPFQGCPEELNPVEIWEIQGSGFGTPLEDQIVLTVGNVVTGVAGNGFYMQTPDDRSDGDESTSDGIFVFTSGPPGVSVGDVVDVSGEVTEFFDLTEFTRGPEVEVVESGAELPEAVILDSTMPDPSATSPEEAFEHLECMRVEFSGGTVCESIDRFGEHRAVASDVRAFREPGIRAPGEPGAPIWDGNPEVFEMDIDELGLDPIELPAGATIERCVGIVNYTFGDYQVLPVELVADASFEVRAVREPAANEITFGTQNLFDLVDNIDDPVIDEEVVLPGDYAARLEKHSRAIREVLQSPTVLAVQEVENKTVLEALADRIGDDDPSVSYTAHLEIGNDPGGRNLGFLVRDNVDVESVEQLATDAVFEGGATPLPLYSRPPLLLDASVGAFAFKVVCVHLRSMSDIDDEDPARADFVRQRRLEQAQWLADYVQSVQEDDPAVRLIVAGDFNAFPFTDGYVDVMGLITGTPDDAGALIEGNQVVDPPLENQVLSVPEDDRYSTVFFGNAQVVDQVITSSALSALVTDVQFGRSNADFPNSLATDSSTPLRASDHDGLVVYVGVEDSGLTFIRGDFNVDGQVNITDPIALLGFLFVGDQLVRCEEAADIDDDEQINITDPINLLQFLFAGGASPAAPFPECGAGTEGESSSCDSFPPCN